MSAGTHEGQRTFGCLGAEVIGGELWMSGAES